VFVHDLVEVDDGGLDGISLDIKRYFLFYHSPNLLNSNATEPPCPLQVHARFMRPPSSDSALNRHCFPVHRGWQLSMHLRSEIRRRSQTRQ